MDVEMKQQRVKLGDIVAIPLPDGMFAFGREFESGLGVYDHVGKTVFDTPKGIRRFLFIVGVITQDLNSGQWPKIGKDSDLPKDSVGWERGYIQDALNGSLLIYDHESGQSHIATDEECRGLEQVAAWGAGHVVDRVMAYRLGQPSIWLSGSPWIPDVVEIGEDGQVATRIPFEKWSAA